MIVSARSGLGNVYVLATALSERVADMLVLVMVSAAVLLTLPSPPGWMAGTGKADRHRRTDRRIGDRHPAALRITRAAHD